MSLSLNVFPYVVPLRAPIRTSRGVMSTRSGWRLRLSCSLSGLSGWGEVACWPGFGSGAALTAQSVARLTQDGALLSALEALSLTEEGGASLSELRAQCAAVKALEARHGLELAALDLRARALKRPLATLLCDRATLPTQALTHCLVSDLEGVRRALKAGYSSLKLKAGASGHWSEDGLLLAQISALLDSEGAQVSLRVDANQAWSENDAIGALVTAAAYGVDWVEEPFQRSLSEAQGWGLWSALQARSGATLAVDESLQQAPLSEPLSFERVEARLEGSLEAGLRVVTLKPMFVGGLLSCAALARRAHRAGARVCVTHALEGAIGRRGAAHLALALSAEGLPVEGGLTGALPVDVARALEVRAGQIQLPLEPGLGAISMEVT